jgi:gamma-glutamylcyclotransferase (GGCT)/AIG2-like uncharacterized protein YtfP
MATYYFAYGPNLNKKQMQERCPENKPKFSAVLPNYRLVFVGWSRQWRGGVVSIKPFRGDKVFGAIYEVTEKDMNRLDRDEGYPGTASRLNVSVFNDNQLVPAITYIKTGQLEEARPSPEYLALIKQGYRDWTIT